MSDTWLRFGKTLVNSHHTTDSPIDSSNVDNLVLKYTAPLGLQAGWKTEMYAAPTATKNKLYLTTQNQFDATGEFISSDGFIMALNRADGSVIWKRLMSTYSGVEGDNARQSPTVFRDFIYIASSVFRPQTLLPYMNVTDISNGRPVTGTNNPTAVYCINRHTGDLVWKRALAQVATEIADEDNWTTITESPVVADTDLYNNGEPYPTLFAQLSSLQSILPWLYTIPLPPPFTPGLSITLGELNSYHNTDRGKWFALDPFSGAVLNRVTFAPSLYTQGDVLTSDSIIPGHTPFLVYHYVIPTDITPGGELNPILPAYAGPNRIRSVLRTGFTPPPFLQGISHRDNMGILAIIPSTPVEENWNLVVVVIEATMNVGANTFNFDGTDFPVDQLLFEPFPDLSSRLIKRLHVGDVLTTQDAYGANYYGCSNWGNINTVNVDRHSKLAVEVYTTSGQNHSIPLDEEVYIDEHIPSYIAQLNRVKRAQVAYQTHPTPAGLKRIRAAEGAIKVNSIKGVELSETLSVRGRRNWFNSFVAINLRPGGMFEVLSVFRTEAKDMWHYGFILTALATINGVPQPGYTDVSEYYGFQSGSDSDFGEGVYLFKGVHQICNDYEETQIDTSTGEMSATRMTSNSVYRYKDIDLIGAVNKAGNAYTVRVLESGGFNPTPIFFTRVGTSGLLGGSVFGSTFDKTNHLYSVQTMSETQGYTNAVPAPGGILPENIPPLLDWYPTTIKCPQAFKPNQSFLIKYDILTGKVKYEEPVTSTNTEPPFIVTIASISSVNDLVLIADSDGNLWFKRTTDGGDARDPIPLGQGGQCHAIVCNKDVYIFEGRSLYAASFPQSNLAPGEFLYAFTLEGCK